jgi:xanthine dehydrogenase accessory factor
MTTPDLYREMARLAEEGVPFVLATVVEAVGSTPRKAGAKMLVLADGTTVDTIGGGKIELQVIEDARTALGRGVSRVAEYELRQTGEHALGMVCGGETRVFLEVNVPVSTLLVVGGGHIGQKLCPMAKLLDFRVVVLDSRPEILTAERFPDADELVVGHPAEAASLVRLDERTHVVIVTHGHLHDKDALRAVVESPVAYIGMIGSRSKVRTVFDELAAEGVAPEALARVRSPVGLDLGGQTPGEISLAILAQIVALRHGRGSDVRAIADAPRGGDE